MTTPEAEGFGDATRLSELLAPWRGGRGHVLSFSANHDQLAVWLTKPHADWIEGPARTGGVVLECVLCRELTFRPVWGPTKLDVSGQSRAPEMEPALLITGDGFFVRCWDAQVTGPFDDFTAMSAWLHGDSSS